MKKPDTPLCDPPGKLPFLLLLPVAVLLFTLTSCGNSRDTGNHTTSNNEPMPFRTISIGSFNHPATGIYSLYEQGIQVIRFADEEEWCRFIDEAMPDAWEREQRIQQVSAEAAFDPVRLLVITAGQRPSSGYAIRIDSIQPAEGSLRIEATLTIPGPDCMLLTVLTFPYHIVEVAIPDSQMEAWMDSEIELSVSESIMDC